MCWVIDLMDEVMFDKKYRVTLLDTKVVPEFLEKIYTYLKKDSVYEEFGTEWFLHYFINGIPAAYIRERLNEGTGRGYSTHLYINKFKSYLSKSYLSDAAIFALKNAYYPKAVLLTGYDNFDLKLEDKYIEVKLRSLNSIQHLEDMIDGKHIKDSLDSNQVIELVVIRFGIMKCVIEWYRIEKVVQKLL